MLIVSVTEDDLEAARRRLGIPGSSGLMHGLEMVCCRGSEIGHLRRWTNEILAEVEKDPPLLNDRDYSGRAAIKLSDLIVRGVATAHCEHGRHRKSRQRRLVEHAIDLAHENAQEIHSVAELSKESGASIRTLRRGFQERFGVSPKTYLLAQRLGGARRDLRSENQRPLVTDVANRWGFWHMGQFAADYRTMFGELPSETLRGRPALRQFHRS
jgi:AraC-like DNA-binding protein